MLPKGFEERTAKQPCEFARESEENITIPVTGGSTSCYVILL